MLRVLLLSIMLALSSFSFSQELLQRSRYNIIDHGQDVPSHVVTDPAGNMYTLSQSGGELLVIKLDPTRNEVWRSRNLGFDSAPVTALAALYDPTGGIIIAYREHRGRLPGDMTPGEDSWLAMMRLSSVNGSRTWTRNYARQYSASDGLRFWMAPDRTLRLLSIGSVLKFNANGTSSATSYYTTGDVIKVLSDGGIASLHSGSASSIDRRDAEGNKLWTTTLSIDFQGDQTILEDETGIYLLGNTKGPVNGPKSVVYKFNRETGSIMWSNIYNASSFDYDKRSAGLLSSDPTYLFSIGLSDGQLGIDKINRLTGQRLWRKKFSVATDWYVTPLRVWSDDEAGLLLEIAQMNSNGTPTGYSHLRVSEDGTIPWINHDKISRDAPYLHAMSGYPFIEVVQGIDFNDGRYSDIVIQRMNEASGELTTLQRFDELKSRVEHWSNVVPAKDGGFIGLLGGYGTYPDITTLARFDQSGTMLWNTDFSALDISGVIGRSFVVGQGSNTYITTRTDYPLTKGYIIQKIRGKNGNVSWQHEITYGEGQSVSSFSVVPVRDDFVMVLYHLRDSYNHQSTLIKVRLSAATGEVQQNLSEPWFDEGQFLAKEHPSGDVIVYGRYSQTQQFIARMNPLSGAFKWLSLRDGRVVADVKYSRNGDVYGIAHDPSQTTSDLTKVSASGALLWARNFTTTIRYQQFEIDDKGDVFVAQASSPYLRLYKFSGKNGSDLWSGYFKGQKDVYGQNAPTFVIAKNGRVIMAGYSGLEFLLVTFGPDGSVVRSLISSQATDGGTPGAINLDSDGNVNVLANDHFRTREGGNGDITFSKYSDPFVSRNLTGTLKLRGWKASQALVPFTIDIRATGSTLVLYSAVVTPQADGTFSCPVTLRDGIYDVFVSSPTGLRKRLRDTIISGTTTHPIGLVSIVNGDVDGNNTIDDLDRQIVIGAMGSIPGDLSWDSRADLNGSGSITAADLTIVDISLGQSGAK